MSIYHLILETIERGQEAALVTIVRGPRSVGEKRFFTASRIAGSLGHEWLDEQADLLAGQALQAGRIEMAGISSPECRKEEFTLVAEPFFPPNQLLILGGGNIALPLAKAASLAGYQITVVDDRPDFANRNRFPEARRVICDTFDRALEKISFGLWLSVVIVTRGHQHDLACLARVIREEPAYIGVIGSRRKVKMFKEHLRSQGIAESRLNRIYMPIGLDINARTPEEIAISVVAELIKVRWGGTARSLSEAADGGRRLQLAEQKPVDLLAAPDKELLRAVVTAGEQETPAALATVIATKGSTPRKAGARMLVFYDGRLLGTIGGGCIEGEVRREALNALDQGWPRILCSVLDSEVAASEGMVCGGRMEILIEPLIKKVTV